MNRQQLLSRLAADGGQILYTTGQWTVWERGAPEWRQAPPFGKVEIMDGVRIDRSPKWLLRFPSHPILDRPSLVLGTRRFTHLMQQLRDGPFLLHVFHPLFQPYAAKLRHAKLVYHAYDLYERTPGWDEKLDEREKWLLNHADLRIASSDYLAQRLSQKGGREVRTLPNGADVAAYQKAAASGTEPPDLIGIPRPRIGYVGRINRKIDLPLIADIARRQPGWQFVLVGPIASLDEVTQEGLARCRALPNVHELGERKPRELPEYVAFMDVTLMPYRTGGGLWTEGIYPLKLHEYLAADRPTVTTPLPSLEPFSHVLEFARNKDEWEGAIKNALANGGTGRGHRVSVASENDWSSRVAVLARWLSEVCA